MKTYQYQLIRYVHDQFTGEFINMGVIVYSPESKFLNCKVSSRYNRLNSFFPTANGRFTKRVVQQIERDIKRSADSMSELFGLPDNLSAITQKILPPDNSAIQLSDVNTAIDIDMETALRFLYFEMVEKNTEDSSASNSLSDEDVWKNKYKNYFDKYHVSDALAPHTVDTPVDKFCFDYAWKNEIWHCYEPVSFYLVNKDSIKDKVYKWAGRIKGLQESDEKLHLTLLASLNPDYKELEEFMDHLMEVDNKSNLSVDVVFDKDAEKVARDIRRQMDEHDLASNSN